MIIDGRALAKEILARAKERTEKLLRKPLVVALTASDTPATRSYLAIKTKKAEEAGCIFETRPLGANVDDADAVIVQLPVPAGVNRASSAGGWGCARNIYTSGVGPLAVACLFENVVMLAERAENLGRSDK